MNRLCGGKSAWEVMEQHEDFKGGANPEADIGGDTVGVYDVTILRLQYLTVCLQYQFVISFVTTSDDRQGGI